MSGDGRRIHAFRQQTLTYVSMSRQTTGQHGSAFCSEGHSSPGWHRSQPVRCGPNDRPELPVDYVRIAGIIG
jgi:hypothetical protein